MTIIEKECECDSFTYWYTGDDGYVYCRCSHSAGEHFQSTKFCLGDVVIIPATLPSEEPESS